MGDGRWLLDSSGEELRRFPLDSRLPTEFEVLDRHDIPIRGKGVSRNGKFVGSVDEDGDLRVLALGEEPRLVFEGRGSSDFRVALDSWGRFATIHLHSLQLFDLDGSHAASPLRLPGFGGGYVGDIDFGPDGQWLATVRFMADDRGRHVCFYPLSREYPRSFRFPTPRAAFDAEFSRDGRRFAWAGSGGELVVWQVPPEDPRYDGELLYRQQDQRSLFSVDFSPDGERIVVGSFTDNTVRVVPLDGTSPVLLEGLQSPITATAFSPSGRLVAAVGAGLGGSEVWGCGDLALWEPETGSRRMLDYSHGKKIWEIRFLDESHLLMAGAQGLELCALEDGSTRVLSNRPTYQGPRGLDVTPDHRYVGYVADGGVLEIIDLTEGSTRTISYDDFFITAVSLHPRLDFVVMHAEGGIVLVQYPDQEHPHVMLRHRGGVWRVHLDLENDWIATAGDSQIRLWPIPTGEPLFSKPRDEFLEILRAQTNVGVVPSGEKPGEYRLDIVRPWNGWEQAPTW
jgi:WD40 repeat protein